eukprot:9324018-Alexandrium_andersonii.AAC.1
MGQRLPDPHPSCSDENPELVDDAEDVEAAKEGAGPSLGDIGPELELVQLSQYWGRIEQPRRTQRPAYPNKQPQRCLREALSNTAKHDETTAGTRPTWTRSCSD